MCVLGASNFFIYNSLLNTSLINRVLVYFMYYWLLEFFVNRRSFKLFLDYLLITFMHEWLGDVVDHLFMSLMDYWLMNLSDFFLVDDRLMMFMNNVLMLLMNYVLVVLMDHIFMMFMNNVLMMLLNYWLINYCFNSGW